MVALIEGNKTGIQFKCLKFLLPEAKEWICVDTKASATLFIVPGSLRKELSLSWKTYEWMF